MGDKLLELYNNLIKDNYDLPAYEVFKADMSDPVKSLELHKNLLADDYDLPDYDTFLGDMGLKKKDISEVGGEVSETSGQEQPQLPPEKPKEERATSRFGDVLRSLKSGSLRALGGITGTPSFLNRTFMGFAVRPIVKSMGGTDEEANYVLDNLLIGTPAGAVTAGGAGTQQRLVRKAQETDKKLHPIEGSIWENIKGGNLGDAGELLGRGFAQSLPYLAMTAATAGGGSVAVLSIIGATAASQQYAELEGQKESKRILNSWLYGGFEAAGELVTAGLVRGVGRAYRQGAIKTVNENFVKGATREIARSFGLEGSSEAMTQIGQNFTDIITGVDENKNILSGVLDAFLIGGVAGGGIGAVHSAAAIVGKTIASDKEVVQVQENVKQQEVLIEQLDQTDSDPIKNALKRSIKDLQFEADKTMDTNYELAKRLTPEEQDQTTELYSVWNELQDKIDNNQLTEQEIPAVENTIKGIKDQIQTIKDNLITRLTEEASTKAEKEAKEGEKVEKPTIEEILEIEEKPPIEEVKPAEEITPAKTELLELEEKPTEIIEPNWEIGQERPFVFDPNSTKNEGRFRLYPPEEIQKDTYFRRKSTTEGVSYVMGKNQEGEEVIQAIRFDKNIFTEDQARNWWDENKEKYKFAQVAPEVKEITPTLPEGETKYRKTQINSLIQDQTLQQQEVARIVDANKERYTVLHDENAVISAKKMIDDFGVPNATIELEDRTRNMQDFPIRNTARMVLFNLYSKALIDPNASEVDKTIASNHITKLQQIMARENTPAGQGISAMRMWKEMQPASLLEYTIRKINEANTKTLNKKIGETTLGEQLDELYGTLTTESQSIIRDILAGKKIVIPEITKVKPPVARKYVPKEKIQAEHDYRKNLIAEYKRTKGVTLSASVTGLTSAQIELGGNLLASYIREGYYRVQEVIDKLKSDFKEAGVELDDKQTEELLSQGKNKKESFGEYLEKKESKARMREGEKLISKKISDVITEHWTEKDELKRTLAQKLMDEAGLTEEEAIRLEKEILAKFDEEILKRSQKQLTKIIGTERISTAKKKVGISDKMIKLINLGALDEDLYRSLFAEKFKLVEITDQHKEEILRLANNVQMSSGKGWLERDATIKLAKYIYELYPPNKTGEFMDTWIAMAYANMLSGPSTSILNLASAGSNMLFKPLREVANLSKWLQLIKSGTKGKMDIYNPFGEMMYVPTFRGMNLGAKEMLEVYRNGDLNNKYIEQVAKKNQFNVTQLERDKYGKAKRFKPITVKIGDKTYNLGNIFNLYKYAGRNLSAQDKFMLTTSYEIELAHILRDNLKLQGLTGRTLTKEVMSIFRGEHIDMDKLNATLTEDVSLYKKLTGTDMTKLQKNIRKRELMLEELPITKEEREEAERLARSNIFTDDRGGLFGTVAEAIGRIANSSPVAGMIVKPFVPFTKVVGNVAEYMMDHVPYYGLLRANGLSVTTVIKKLGKIGGETAQMGEKGSRAYYEQMGRAWFGTMAFSLAMMFLLGKDEDDFMELTGGYSQEGFKKRGRENVTPPYTLRIGTIKIPYKNVPSLAIPFALIGNINDALKMEQDEGDIQDRLTASLLFDATMNSVFMVKDMTFLDGVQRGTQIIADMASTDEKKLASIGEGLIKSYLGFATRPLPQNNNAVQQIWKIFDPVSYSQSDIKGMLGYAAGIQHFIGKPSLDQFGDEITSYPGETLMPYTHWLKIKGTDERWKFLAKYNAIPNKLYNRTMNIESKDGLEKRQLEANELYDYTLRTGQHFSKALLGYMSDIEKVAIREKDIIEREKNNGEIEKINGIREDVEKLWADAKDKAEMELFRWGSVKEEMPQIWDLIKRNEAYQSYQESKSINGTLLDKSQLYEFNNRASLRYAEKIENYLKSEKAQKDKEKDTDKDGISNFQETIDKLWTETKDFVTSRMTRELRLK